MWCRGGRRSARSSTFAVGTRVTPRPPHRSGQAQLRHPAPASGNWRQVAWHRVLSHAVQRLWHAYPVLCPARALLARSPLGPRPWLHRLRDGSLRFVRRLRCYYDGVRLLGFVHHRLRLLVFPMRTWGRSPSGQTRDLPVPVQRASTHARVFDHAGLGGRSH